MLEKIKNNEINNLVEILNIKLKLLQDIYDLTRKQSKMLNDEDVDSFIKIIERKDLRIRKINELDKRYKSNLKEIREEYSTEDLNDIKSSSEILVLEESIQEILKNIYGFDKSNRERFDVEFNKMRSSMVDVKKSRKVTSSYYKMPTQLGGHFIDKKR